MIIELWNDEYIIKCYFCNKEITLGESRLIHKRAAMEETIKTYLGCRVCQATETIPYDHEEIWDWRGK
jgi:hypothetical protein